MIYQLPNGKSIFLTVEQYLQLTDKDLNELIADGSCTYIEDPFCDSSIKENKHFLYEYEEIEIPEDLLAEDDYKDLTDLDIDFKYSDLDTEFDNEF